MSMPASRRSPLAITVSLLAAVLLAAAACSLHPSARMAAPARYAMAGDTPTERPPGDHNTEAYDRIYDNPFLAARANPLSTFSIDVDTASYANVRRFLREEHLPPPDAVRIEELVNYFRYAYPAPEGAEPLAVTTEVGPCAWNRDHRLVRIGLRARDGRARTGAGAQPDVPHRRLGIDGRPEEAAAAEALSGAARRSARGAGPDRDRGLRGRVGRRAAADLGRRARADPRRAGRPARGRLHQRRRGNRAGVPAGRTEPGEGRRQPRDPRDRRRLQRRHHQPGRSDPPDRGEARRTGIVR